jgi:hypothetical protein
MQIRTFTSNFKTGYDEHARISFGEKWWSRKAHRLFLPPEAGLEKVSYCDLISDIVETLGPIATEHCLPTQTAGDLFLVVF